MGNQLNAKGDRPSVKLIPKYSPSIADSWLCNVIFFRIKFTFVLQKIVDIKEVKFDIW